MSSDGKVVSLAQHPGNFYGVVVGLVRASRRPPHVSVPPAKQLEVRGPQLFPLAVDPSTARSGHLSDLSSLDGCINHLSLSLFIFL